MTEVKCGFDGCESGTPETEACLPIPIPDDDPDFRYNRCMKFVRSQEVPVLSCTFGKWVACIYMYTFIVPLVIYLYTKILI